MRTTHGLLNDLILTSLTLDYDLIDGGSGADSWDTKDALRKVKHYYSTEDQYKGFKEERGL